MKIWKRALAALLVCLLLPVGAFAEGGVRFSIGFSAPVTGSGSLVDGLMSLLNSLTIEGTFEGEYNDDYAGNGFDLRANVLLDNSERTRTNLRLYGFEGVMHVESSLLGSADVMLNLPALIEFGVKMNVHMGIPLNQAALLNPYTTRHALSNMQDWWNIFMHESTETRSLNRSRLHNLANSLTSLSIKDARFYYWVQTLGEEAGLDELINGLFGQLTSWVDEELPEEGLTIEVSADGTETYIMGGETLAVVSADSTVIDLPELPSSLAFRYTEDKGEDAYAMTMYIAQEGETILDVTLNAEHLPKALPISEPFSVTATVDGRVTDGQPLTLSILGDGSDGAFTLRINADPLPGEMVVSGTLVPYTPDTMPAYDHTALEHCGVNVFSLNDVTLIDFVRQVAKPMVLGVLPLIAHLPSATCTAIMDTLEEAGLFEMAATGSFGTGEHSPEADETEGPDGASDEDEEYVDTSDDLYDEDDWDFGGDSTPAETQTSADDGFEDDDWDFGSSDTPTETKAPADDGFEDDDWDFDAPAASAQTTDAPADSEDGYEEDDWDF